MNIRQKYELKMLSDDGYMDMSKIAELFSINLRTVRYDIQILNEYLCQELGEEGITVTNKMAKVTDTVRERLPDIVDLNVKDFYTDRVNAEERMLLMVFDLCWSNDYSTIQNLADKYFVSRATVNKDIIAIKEYCRKNEIRFVSNRGKGLCIEADELERRKHLSRVIRDLTVLKSKDEWNVQTVYSQWFEDSELETIRTIVMEAEDKFSTYLADVAYEALVIHIALSVERFRTNSQYENLEGGSETRVGNIQYRMADEIVRGVNEAFQIQLPDTEIYYVALHIGAKSSDAIKRETQGDASLEYYCIRMISGVSRRIGYDLTNDERLYESLLQHLNVCLYRKKSGMMLENPLKEELIGSYPQLYDIIRQMVEQEENPEFIISTDDEIAYILLHFATSIYRRKQNENRLADVVVVCATGIGTAELVITGLRRSFRLNIKGAVAAHQLDNFLKKQEVDLIITTVPLKRAYSCLHVSPLLKRDDIVRIGKQLLDLGFDIEKPVEAKAGWSDTAKWLEYLLQNYAGKEQEEILKSKLRLIPITKKIVKEEKRYMLSELLNEESMCLDVECTDWQDCVRASGKMLIKKGDITEEYIQAVIDNVNEVGPYIVITKGVALPHATNKVGVNRTSMSFVRLGTPVNFGNKYNDPVKYVFMLATTDANSHLGALQDLAEFLEREEFMAVLEAAKEPADIISYIQSNESSRESA